MKFRLFAKVLRSNDSSHISIFAASEIWFGCVALYWIETRVLNGLVWPKSLLNEHIIFDLKREVFPWSERFYLLESNYFTFFLVKSLQAFFFKFQPIWESTSREPLQWNSSHKYFYLVLNIQLVSLLYTYFKKHTTLPDVHSTFLLKNCFLSVTNSISRCNTVRILWYWELLSSDDLMVVFGDWGAWENRTICSQRDWTLGCIFIEIGCINQ